MFTTTEYIAKHGLDVDPSNPWATRMIAKHLKRLGYTKIRKDNRWLWVKPEQSGAHQRKLLEDKLKQLENANG